MAKTGFRLPPTIAQFGIAIFPCLKTSAPISIGGYTFRSTTDISELPPEQATAVSELASMLYARDDIRIAEATYAITSHLGSLRPGPVMEHLARIRSIVGYIYSSPHPTLGDAFMPFDFASLAVVQPANVSVFLVRPDYRTVLPPLPDGFVEDDHHETPGYEGAYNERPIWLAKGSRIYGGHTHTVLNMSQNLFVDVGGYRGAARSGREMLLELLDQPTTPFSERIFTSIDWYNCANGGNDKPDRSLLALSVAFEVLLELPSSEKTDRLSDSIALLLGRTVRLKDWAAQFYKARSQVAHEGKVKDWWFHSPSVPDKAGFTHKFGSVMTYGLEIFQLCVATILTGAKLAGDAGLAERFVANSERYNKIAETLREASEMGEVAIAAVEPLVDELARYQFVSSPVPLQDVITAIQAAALALTRCERQISEGLAVALRNLYNAPKKDVFAALSALEELERWVESADWATLGLPGQTVSKLIKVGWNRLFMTFYQLKAQQKSKKGDEA